MPKTIDKLYEAAIESIEAFATTYPGYWKAQDNGVPRHRRFAGKPLRGAVGAGTKIGRRPLPDGPIGIKIRLRVRLYLGHPPDDGRSAGKVIQFLPGYRSAVCSSI